MDLSRGTWSDAGMSTHPVHDVTRLTHRKEYLFRVKAVNAIGESEPLEAAKIVHTVNCQRVDSGRYHLLLRNDSGIDEGSFELIVLDRPGPPVGPLEYEEITANSVTISWKPPKDNGGSEISAYVIEKHDLTHGGGWFQLLLTSGAPSKPEFTESDKDHIAIKWKAPISNGGSPVIGYDIERRDIASGRWLKINAEPVPNTAYTDDRVTADHQYQYRVSAVNAAGNGKHSEPSSVFTAKSMREKPRLHLDGLIGRKVKVRAGEPVNINIPISGAPSPTIEWKRGSIKVPENNRFSFSTNPERTIFRIDDTARDDAGVYNITASNEFGKDSADIEIIVVDKPTPPGGPLTYTETTPDHISLSWNPPKTMEVVILLDTLLKATKGRPHNKESVTLSWRPPRNDGKSKIKGYYLEIKPKNSKNWEPVNELPISNTVYTVPNLKEGEEYSFRVSAVNEVGRSDPSKPSQPIVIEEQANKPCMDLGGVRDITCRAGEDFSIHVPYVGFPKPTAHWFLTVPKPPTNLCADEFAGDALTLYWTPPKDDGGSPITNYIMKERSSLVDLVKGQQLLYSTICSYTQSIMAKNMTSRVLAENKYGQSDPATTDEHIRARHPFDVPNAPGVPRGVDSTEDSITISWTKPRHDGGSPITGPLLASDITLILALSWKTPLDDGGSPITNYVVENLITVVLG
ncbi:Twitchin [Eumeta japonica]|uniref:Twitchin n=1 Tax=Eumeta variegata TaxID=151549 RepID=A0A4C1T400_EUMVA|nr:Twitchin [Eumeta japonica]